ncbi:uncharacterized protein LOC131230681 [Magnolia sinica]|uniref:uncharacterized protein LOC131230681 n=1 Tax=Magnolia sinica TaxID=86752 RepID=UPI002658DA55|nr:uncharacterized protein LOC131230681 [Magnolia sinica]
MGNTISCAPSIASSRVVKVVCLDGRVEVYTRPVNAAELMLENPSRFVCDASDLKVGHRIPGLAADEDLEPRHLYFLLPMNMLYSVLTPINMASLSHNASKAFKQGGPSKNIGKIFPVFGDSCIFPSEIKPSTVKIQHPNPNQRFSRQRSWRPALDTIVESPRKL